MKKRKVPSGRRYRVLKTLHWIEGGRLDPVSFWKGGRCVVYEPGDTVYVRDEELATSNYHKLEALDDAGRAALERFRAEAEAPARRTVLSDSAAEKVASALKEKGRAYGSRVEEDVATLRDGSKQVLTRVFPINPLPNVVYDDNGIPDPYATAALRQREEQRQRQKELEQREADRQHSRRKGGLAPKHLPGLQAVVDRLIALHSEATARELWDLIPERDDDESDDDTARAFTVYRDGTTVVQLEGKTGRERGVSFRSFCRYVTRARRK